MKKALFLLLLSTLIFTSCQDFYGDSGDYTDQLPDDGFDVESPEGEEGDLTLYKVNGNSITKIHDYDVKKKYLDLQEDTQLHEDVWELTTTLIPEIYRDKIDQYQVFVGEGELLGYVEAVEEDDLSKWRFALGIDEASGLSQIDFSNEFIYTIIHEYGHVLTLNDDQLDVTDEGQCDNYFTGEGCAKENAYINKIVEIGWADILDKIEGTDEYEIYDAYPDRFSTEYAATNPGEDVAEVFTMFIILEKMPRGSKISDKKIQALYDFPELVRLRDEIRDNAGPVKMRQLDLEGYKAIRAKIHKNHVH